MASIVRRRTRRNASPARDPGLVVARGLRPAALRQSRTGGTVRPRRAGAVGPVRFPPRARDDRFLRRRHIDSVMHPAVPRWRNARGFDGAIVDHPAPLEPERRIDLATLGAVVAVAELVLANELAVKGGRQQRAEGRPVPPGEEAQEKRFHQLANGSPEGGAFMPPSMHEVQAAGPVACRARAPILTVLAA